MVDYGRGYDRIIIWSEAPGPVPDGQSNQDADGADGAHHGRRGAERVVLVRIVDFGWRWNELIETWRERHCWRIWEASPKRQYVQRRLHQVLR